MREEMTTHGNSEEQRVQIVLSYSHILYFQHFVMPQTSILDLVEWDFRMLRFFGLRPLI